MKEGPFELKTERLGPLPLLNHFIERLGLAELIDAAVPTSDGRCRLAYAKAIGVLLRSIATEREPVYRLAEAVSSFAPEGFGLGRGEADSLTDDAVGRALDRLFDADRASLTTEVVIAAQRRFALALAELHNDSTTVKFSGQYSKAKGRSIRGKKAPYITYGYSKDHRPDLKQLLFILTTTSDGSVPVQFRCCAGNASDSRSHEDTWDALRLAVSSADFLYVADSKLCSPDAMEYIDREGGRFVTVLPRSRHEDSEFRQWIQGHTPAWEKVRDRENPKGKGGPRDRCFVVRYRVPSQEGWPLFWVFSTLLRLKQAQSRRERISAAEQDLSDLARTLAGPRCRLRSRYEVRKRIDGILERYHVKRYLKISLKQVTEHAYRQERRGRPGPDTKYVRQDKKHFSLSWTLDEEAIAYDHKSDGMYPLLTNDRSLTASEVFCAHKRQPEVERRFCQTKSSLEIAPVLLKNEGRVEALFFCYFLALLVCALIERELRLAMAREGISELPLYPEERVTSRPTSEQVFRLFNLMERHNLTRDGELVQAFEPNLSELQKQVLGLLGVPLSAYCRG
jgi:transposase